jgi:hypothetical protein
MLGADPANLSSPLFTVQILASYGSDEYGFEEVWLSGGVYTTKTGGRYGGSLNPGVALDGASFNIGDFALCRSADGAGGLRWELLPLGGACPTLGGENGNDQGSVTVDNTWVDLPGTGLGTFIEIELPQAGTYLLFGKVAFFGQLTSAVEGKATVGQFLAARVRNVDSGHVYENSVMLCTVAGYTTPLPQDGDGSTFETRSFTIIVAAHTAGTRIRLQGYRSLTADTDISWTQALIGSPFYSALPHSAYAPWNMGWQLLCPFADTGAGSGSCVPNPLYAEAGWYCVLDPLTAECVPLELEDGDECDPDIVICSGPYATQEDAEAACGESGSGGGDAEFPCCEEAEAAPTSGTVTIPANACGLLTSYALSVFSSGGSVLATFTGVTPEDPLNGTSGFLQCTEAVEGGWWSQIALSAGGGTSYPAVTGTLVSAACDEDGVTITMSYTFESPCFTTLVIIWRLDYA